MIGKSKKIESLSGIILGTTDSYLHVQLNSTVKPVFSDHIKQELFWRFRQMFAYCCMKVVCTTLIQQLATTCLKTQNMYGFIWSLNTGLTVHSDNHWPS